MIDVCFATYVADGSATLTMTRFAFLANAMRHIKPSKKEA